MEMNLCFISRTDIMKYDLILRDTCIKANNPNILITPNTVHPDPDLDASVVVVKHKKVNLRFDNQWS